MNTDSNVSVRYIRFPLYAELDEDGQWCVLDAKGHVVVCCHEEQDVAEMLVVGCNYQTTVMQISCAGSIQRLNDRDRENIEVKYRLAGKDSRYEIDMPYEEGA